MWDTLTDILYQLVVWCAWIYIKIEKSFVRLLAKTGFVEKFCNEKLAEAGITVNGTKPYDIQVCNKEFYISLVCDGTLGIGESYMNGWWDSDNIDQFVTRVFTQSNIFEIYLYNARQRFLNYLLLHAFNLQTKSRAWEVGENHYDLGNHFFKSFLDKTMNYSCGYWKIAKNLEQAQIAKMNIIAQKLKLKPGMRVLDIGCGWGSLAKYLAENYNVFVVGCTISAEQAALAKENCTGLPVDIRLVDYRDMNEQFDRIVSVGMFEHVGQKNYQTFFKIAYRCLTDEGIFLLHTIGMNHKYFPKTEPWFHKYIFPNGILPYHTDISVYTDNLFIMEDWHNFGHYYDKTLMAWHDNFMKNWEKICADKGLRFVRMWKYYLLLSASGFRARKYQVWQIVFTKKCFTGIYESVR